MSVTTIRVTDDYDRAHITDAIALLNVDAKAMSRAGKTRTLTPSYAATHARINALLDELESKQ